MGSGTGKDDFATLRSRWTRETVRPAAGAESAAVDVWRVPVTAQDTTLRSLAGLLDPEEQAKADRFRRDEDRRRFVTARGAVRVILAPALGVDPGDVVFEPAEHGKPRLGSQLAESGFEFNYSHSGEWVYVALARDHGVGVDVEALRSRAAIEEIRKTFLTPKEDAAVHALPAGEQTARLFQLWTRKEAVIKAVGRGLAMALDVFEVGGATTYPGSHVVVVQGVEEAEQRIALCDLACPEGYAASVAICVPD